MMQEYNGQIMKIVVVPQTATKNYSLATTQNTHHQQLQQPEQNQSSYQEQHFNHFLPAY